MYPVYDFMIIIIIIIWSGVLAEKNIHHNMSSFNESVALGCLKQAAIELVKYAFNSSFTFTDNGEHAVFLYTSIN